MTRPSRRTSRFVTLRGRPLYAIRQLLDIPSINPWKLREEDRVKHTEWDGAWGINYRTLSRYERLDASVPDESIRRIFSASRKTAQSFDQDPLKRDGGPFLVKVCALQCDTIKQAVDALLATRTDFIIDGDVPVSLRDEIRALANVITPTNKEEQALAASLSGNSKLADKILKELLAGSKAQSFQLCVKLAENWIRNGQFDDAIAPLRDAIAHNPNDTVVRFMLVRAHLYAGDGDVQEHWQSALGLLQRRVSRKDPAWIDQQTWLGISWFKCPQVQSSERLRKAKRFFRRAISGAKDDLHAAALPRNHLAVMLFLSGNSLKRVEAHDLLEKTMKLWSEETHPYNWGLANLRMGNYWLETQASNKKQGRINLNRAERHYDAAVRVFANVGYKLELAQVRYSMADLAMARAAVEPAGAERHFDEATRLCEKAITGLSAKRRDDWHRAHFNLAESCFRRPDPTESHLENAIQGYREAATVYANGVNPPDWAWTHCVLAAALLSLAQLRECDCRVLVSAISSIKAAVSVNSNPMLAQSKARLKELQQLYAQWGCNRRKPFDTIRPADY